MSLIVAKREFITAAKLLVTTNDSALIVKNLDRVLSGLTDMVNEMFEQEPGTTHSVQIVTLTMPKG